MKNKKIKLNTLLISAALVTSAITPVLASCNKHQDEPEVKSKYFEIVGDELKGFKEGLTEEQKKEACPGGVLTLPAVSKIAEKAFDAELLRDAPFAKKIIIDSTTTEINARAFYGNEATEITWNGGVASSKLKHIGKSAFAYCQHLTKFEVPVGLITNPGNYDYSIEDGAFFSCISLKQIDMTAASSTEFAAPKWAPGAFSGIDEANGQVIFNLPKEGTLQKFVLGYLWSRLVLAGIKPTWKEYSENYLGELVEWSEQITVVPEEYITIEDKVITGVNTSMWTEDTFNTIVITKVVSGEVTGITMTLTGDTSPVKDFNLKYITFQETSITEVPKDFDTDDARGDLHIYWPANGLTSFGENSFKGSQTINDFGKLTGIKTIGDSAFEGNDTITSFVFAQKDIAVGNRAFYNAHKLQEIDLSSFDTQTKPEWTGTEIFVNAGNQTDTKNIINLAKGITNPVDCWRLRRNFQTFLSDKGLTIDNTGVKNKWKFEPPGWFTDVSQLLDIDNYGVLHGWAKDSDGKRMSALEVSQALEELKFNGKLTLDNVYAVDNDAFCHDGTSEWPVAGTGQRTITVVNFTKAIGIGERAFKGATSLENIALYTSCKYIGASAFEGCTKLGLIRMAYLTWENVSALTVGDSAFKSISATGTVNVLKYDNQFDQWQHNYLIKTEKFKDLTFKDGAWKFNNSDSAILVNITDGVVDGLVKSSKTPAPTDKSLVNLAHDKYGTTHTIFRIPATATSIKEKAFVDGKKSLIPAAFDVIDFGNVGGTNQCKSIGEYAFFYCGDHTKEGTEGQITLDFTNAASLTTIGNHAFGLARIGGTLSLPKTLTSIGEGAFYETEITKLVLPLFDKKATFDNGSFAGISTLEQIDLSAYITDAGGTASTKLNNLTDWETYAFEGIKKEGKIIVDASVIDDETVKTELLTKLKDSSLIVRLYNAWTFVKA